MKKGYGLAGAAALALGMASLAFAAGTTTNPGADNGTSSSAKTSMPSAHQAAGMAKSDMAKAGMTKPAKLTAKQKMEIQKALAAHGFHVKADGKWGKKSKEALAAFQKKHGLPATGHPDAKTLEALGLHW